MYNNKISIITPNYNSSEFIEETLNSVIKQTYKNWELIIVDDISTDNSVELINNYTKKDKRIKIFFRDTKNKGASVCRNIGIMQSTGDYIIFLDSDDLLAPYCLADRIKEMKNNPELDFGIFKMAIFHKKIDDNNIINIYSKDNDYLNIFLRYIIPWQTTCPIWKSIFIKKNNIKFDERYQRLQDPEFHTKILLNKNPKYKVFKEKKVDCYYRNINKPNTQKSIEKITNGFLLYINDIEKLMSFEKFIHYKKIIYSKSIHLLLFQYKLYNFKYIYNFATKMKPEISFLEKLKILLFYIFNRTGITFIKGFGISRLWKWIEYITK